MPLEKFRYFEYKLWALIVLLLSLAIFLPPVQDYREYLNQWDLVLTGVNPWKYLGENRTNFYGPLHVVLAYAKQLFYSLPRLLSTLLALGIFFKFFRIDTQDNAGRNSGSVPKFLYLYNPFIWLTASVIGHNDVFVMGFILFALHFYDKKPGWSGVFVAFGFLLKIYPLVIVPYLSLKNRALNGRFLISFLSTCCIGLFITYLVWDLEFVTSITYNSTRYSKFLSIFRFLRGDLSPLGFFSIGNIDHTAVYIVLLSQGIMWLISIKYRFEAKFSVMVSLLLLFTFYHVGHPQFHFTVIGVMAYYLIWQDSGSADESKVKLSIYIYVFWISTVSVVNGIWDLSGFNLNLIRTWIGLPTFIIQIYALWTLLSIEKSRVKQLK